MEKGGLWFTKTVACLVGKDCQRDWRHIGIICFPNIDNREFFRSNKIESEEMLKVLYFTFYNLTFFKILSSVCLDEERVRGW